jgi:hypothetical protein
VLTVTAGAATRLRIHLLVTTLTLLPLLPLLPRVVATRNRRIIADNSDDAGDSDNSEDTVTPTEPYDAVKAYGLKEKLMQADLVEMSNAIVQKERLEQKPGN